MAQTLREIRGQLVGMLAQTVSAEWDLDANPPTLTLHGASSNVDLLLEDMGSEVLVSLGGIDTSGSLQPDASQVLAVVSSFDREHISVVRSRLGRVPVGSWLEMGTTPIVYGRRRRFADYLIQRLPGYSEERTAIQPDSRG